MKNTKNKIGLIGLGVVGQGLYQLLQGIQESDWTVKSIAVKDLKKARTVDPKLITSKWELITGDPQIDIVVEAIDDANVAWAIAQQTLKAGKTLITANKKMVATHLEELIQLANESNAVLRYEAAVGGAIPVLGLLDHQFAKEPIRALRGIVNGTTNYILTKIFQEKLDYTWALQQAQALGFAESDPTSDVQAYDAMYKAILLTKQAYGVVFKPNEVLHYGIDTLTSEDIRFARNQGLRIKLIQQTVLFNGGVATWVLPQFVTQEQDFYHTSNEINAIEIEAEFSGKHWIQGRGAGAFPTAFALLQDLQHVNTVGTYQHLQNQRALQKCNPNDLKLEVYVRYTHPEIKKLLDLENVREALIDDDYTYLIGEISLAKLLLLKPQLLRDRSSIILTGRRPAYWNKAITAKKGEILYTTQDR